MDTSKAPVGRDPQAEAGGPPEGPHLGKAGKPDLRERLGRDRPAEAVGLPEDPCLGEPAPKERPAPRKEVRMDTSKAPLGHDPQAEAVGPTEAPRSRRRQAPGAQRVFPSWLDHRTWLQYCLFYCLASVVELDCIFASKITFA
jgi:hypothetical protein